ncbi:Mpo1-like protein, partial [Streptomyces exfoliatus]|uniref:Mpo1-like protein n=1 Tax=Streptomyces exfoliatus TaxID=1905 RepID=UPI0031FA3FDA
LGRTVHLRFRYTTGDASGQNMTTACTWHACRWILRQPHLVADGEVESFLIEGNNPATFGHPAWSLRGDVRMIRMMLAGRDRELAETAAAWLAENR